MIYLSNLFAHCVLNLFYTSVLFFLDLFLILDLCLQMVNTRRGAGARKGLPSTRGRGAGRVGADQANPKVPATGVDLGAQLA